MNVKKTKSSKKIILKITMSMTMASGETFRLAEVEAGELKWNKFACHDFMCKVASIVDLIATLVHIGTGPPCCGTEQMEDQISNGLKPRTF